MKGLGSDYTDCAIFIYDTAGNLVCSTAVTKHDRKTMQVEVKDIPPSLGVGAACAMLIITSPTPCEYQGRIINDGVKKIIAMYRGRERENRGAARYKINSPALIENLIRDGNSYPLNSPISIEVIEISKSGLRFSAMDKALTNCERFQMRMKISNSDKLLVASIVHIVYKDNGIVEYGCNFLSAN